MNTEAGLKPGAIVRHNFDASVSRIEEGYGRVEKSIMVITDWIIRSNKFANDLKKKKKYTQLDKIYHVKHQAVQELIKTNLMNVEVYTPVPNNFYWLYVLSLELDNVKVTICVPYNKFRKTVRRHYKYLEVTQVHSDSIIMDGIDITKDLMQNKQPLSFVMENLEKSRLKLIEKMEGR